MDQGELGGLSMHLCGYSHAIPNSHSPSWRLGLSVEVGGGWLHQVGFWRASVSYDQQVEKPWPPGPRRLHGRDDERWHLDGLGPLRAGVGEQRQRFDAEARGFVG